jgi:pimeloyl-ACP methyl ester carboxylesterase
VARIQFDYFGKVCQGPVVLRALKERAKAAADHFRSRGVDILAYNTVESAHDVDDLRKALGAEKLNLVGFSYGTHRISVTPIAHR